MIKGGNFILKINITINDDLLKKVDSYAKSNYLKRSSVVSLALLDYLDKYEYFFAVSCLSLALKKIASTGKIDAESVKRIEVFQNYMNRRTKLD